MITIREYQKIFAADCPCFDELSKFTEAGDFLSLGWQRNGGAYVQAKNYVGVIRLPSGYQIEILPKIHACDDAGDLSIRTLLAVDDLRPDRALQGLAADVAIDGELLYFAMRVVIILVAKFF